MIQGRERGRRGFWVDLFACFLIPAYTLLFAGSVEWFSTNFSVIAVTGRDHYRGFFLWGVMAAGYFFFVLLQTGHTLGSRWARLGLGALTIAACFCLGCALVVPYLPDDFPRYAQLHVLLAFVACVLLMLALLWAVLACRREDRNGYAGLLRAWWLIAGGSGALFAVGGMVTSALEVFFTISAALLARRLWYRRRGG